MDLDRNGFFEYFFFRLKKLPSLDVTEPEVVIKTSNSPTEHESPLFHISNYASNFRKIIPKKLKSSQSLYEDHSYEQQCVEYSQPIQEYSKPSFSYKEMIMLAIYTSPSDTLALHEIYSSIRKYFPYYQLDRIGTTWQNSIRHNLSLNSCFTRLDTKCSSTKVGHVYVY